MPPATEEEIKNLESYLKVKLPGQYRKFSLKYNECILEENVFEAKGYRESLLDKFYGIYQDNPIRDIKENCSVF